MTNLQATGIEEERPNEKWMYLIIPYRIEQNIGEAGRSLKKGCLSVHQHMIG